jgi:chlorophyll/bacteriochlorophyll a synthase
MLMPQWVVLCMLLVIGKPWHAFTIGVLMVVQFGIMRWFVQSPRERALYLSAFGVPFSVAGMMVTAFAIRG